MSDQRPRLLQLKMLLRDVHPAVWRRVRLADCLSIAELHRMIQLLMGWDDDHLHRFRIHGREYGIAYIGGPNFAEDAAAVPLSRFGFRPTERFLYEYDFTAGWQIEVRVERDIEAAPCEDHRVPICVAGRQAGPPDGCGGPQTYAERRRDAVGWAMADDVDTVVAILRRVSVRDAAVLNDPDERWEFERAVSRLKAREQFLAEGFSRAAANAALRQAFTAARGSP
jgi:Plasmid pRiA4b ORF-3-like protein